ncbi:4-hydroxy-tetrahydrodipicolinate synthase [Oceanirhabdus sp. W0125-5]|uniref:4-hydroxy-tetrahydrodipicolinate synthase n=1 Tax=Oceanirhabdus sp. W0125-5 TaxID=2999116 RepID=UPI0022F2B4E7|nr:4-hydroxy-tetrahydrodipicolinate synthase [Oceanirhabdus sp. W0125-5]WBW97507.1 4-hydroxy-tetrahydrodipicolinate synthase [Oceanirhabdus sp. W0125-5]
MIRGIVIPIITPFKNDQINFKDYRKLINHYINLGVKAIIPMGTTGEIHSLRKDEIYEIIEKTIEYVDDRIDIFFGLGGNTNSKVIEQVKNMSKYKFNGFLITCPYYIRPNQLGIKEYYKDIAENTEKDIIIYNIPYRTGVNIENKTIIELSKIPNIVGLKDCCGNILNSLELLRNKPQGFSILTGEDKVLFQFLVSGYDGGILSSAHVMTDEFIKMYKYIYENNHKQAAIIWNKLYSICDTLFKEPNPAPIKYKLFIDGLIESYETRKPIMEVSENLRNEIIKLNIEI